MKKPLIIGNWKANPATYKQARTLLKATEKAITKVRGTYGYAVPEIYVAQLLKEKVKIKGLFGVQTIGTHEGGAHTGRATASMLTSTGVSFTLLGHSEVRSEGETDEAINEKLKSACAAKLYSIVCVGEKTRDPHGHYLKQVEKQVSLALSGIRPEWCHHIAIAYEPVWAVGGSVSATPEECFEVVIGIRRTLANSMGIAHAKKVSILYGGTVTKENAKTFLVEGGADGLLIGRTSLDPKAFANIITGISYEKET